MKSKYTSGKSVGKNQTVPIGVDDPRLKPAKRGQTYARQGAEIQEIGLDGKTLISGGRTLNNPAGVVSPTTRLTDPPSVVIPPMGNKPPKTYPGGSGPVIIVPTDPQNVSVVWSGNNLVISFDWDYANELNDTVSQFIVELTSGGVTKRTPANTFVPNITQTAQTITVTKSMITSMFNVFRTSFSSVCVLTGDPLNNISNSICAPSVPSYVLDLPTPVINVAAITSGYSVSYTTPTQDVFDGIEIVEYESNATVEPTGVTYQRTFFSTLNPAVVITPNFNKRWVKARFSSDGGIYTPYSAAQAVTPSVIGLVDQTPPNEVVSASAVWSGDNVIVSYQLPSTDPAFRVEIALTSTNSLVGYFYRFPTTPGTSQTATITKRDLLEQFGQHYSSFTGLLKSTDSNDNKTSGVSFNVPQRANPLTGIVPTFSITPLTNGYSIFGTNYESSTGATYMEVYAKHTPWLADPANDDDVVYAGANPAVIIDTDYTPVYVKVRYYDDFDNGSSYSNQSNNSTTPIDSGMVTSFENPITFGVNGVIYAGANYNSGNRTLFKTGGIFAYDADGIQTTQILSDADAGTPTFITQRAQIADWNITDTKIENDLSGAPTSYTGLSATGTYSFWAGSTVSGGNSTSKFTVTPAGEVTAREITILGNGGTDPLISAGGLFTVNNDGSFTATSADIQGVIKANSGEFLGNVLIKSGGSLYSPKTTGTIPAPGVPGVIFDNDAISAFGNTSSSYTQIYSTPLADGSTFKTTAANIGGWKIDDSSISRTGTANISLNSTAGNISVSAQNVSAYTSGINGPIVSSGSTPVDDINGTPVGAENVFWAGTGGATGTSNAFRVTLAGNLYASNAKITGTVSSVGALGTMTMDGEHGYMSLQTAGSSAPVSYLVPRNNNIYLTSPSLTEPWSTGKQIASSGPVNGPYISAGSSYKDYWGNTTTGTGMFVGAWDYFSTGSSKPFITATDTGIQLSVSPDLGLLLDRGDATLTGTNLMPAVASGTPSMLFYTAKQSGAPYSPTTTYGAWAAFTNNKIKLTAAETVFINIDGTVGSQNIEIASTANIWQKFTSSAIKTQVSSSIYQQFDSSGIRTQISSNVYQQFDSSGIKINSATNTFVNVGTDSTITLQGSNQVVIGSGIGQGGAFPVGGVSAYEGPSKITLDPTYGVVITGVQVQRDLDMTDAGSGGNYRNTPPLGRYPRSRMLIEDPVTGQVMLGMGVYYRGSGITSTPTSDTGYAGDLLIDF